VVEKCAQPGGNSLVSANTVYPATSAEAPRLTRYLIEVSDGSTPAELIDTLATWGAKERVAGSRACLVCQDEVDTGRPVLEES
jgi:hypothetical protein